MRYVSLKFMTLHVFCCYKFFLKCTNLHSYKARYLYNVMLPVERYQTIYVCATILN